MSNEIPDNEDVGAVEGGALPELNAVQDEPHELSESQQRLGLEPVHKVLVRVQAVLGQTKVNVGDLLGMRSGDVIDLDKRVGEPVDIWVNNRLIARGEVVLTGGQLGVALTEMVKQAR